MHAFGIDISNDEIINKILYYLHESRDANITIFFESKYLCFLVY